MKYKKIKLSCENNNRIYRSENKINFKSKNEDIPVDIIITKINKNMVIEITSERYVNSDFLLEICLDLLTFNMLFTGFFLDVSSIKYLIPDTNNNCCSRPHREETSQLLDYFKSNPEIKNMNYEFYAFPTSHQYKSFFEKWLKIKEDLDISFRMFMYINSDISLPIDMKSAFIIQCFQPLAEYLSKNHHIEFDEYKPNKYGNYTLKDKLTEVVRVYGSDLFTKESDKIDAALQILVNSRNRIAHIKYLNKKFLIPNECVVYNAKLNYLYRHIILQVIGIDFELYKKQLCSYVKIWDEHLDIVNDFLKKLK